MEQRLAFRPGGKSMVEMLASHIMLRDFCCFGKDVYCDVLVEKIFKKGFGSIPIIDKEKRLIGLVSEYDILNALEKGMDLPNTLAFEVMTQKVVSVKEGTAIEEVIDLLQSRHFIRVPVVDAKGKLVGIVARRDVLGAYVKSGVDAL